MSIDRTVLAKLEQVKTIHISVLKNATNTTKEEISWSLAILEEKGFCRVDDETGIVKYIGGPG